MKLLSPIQNQILETLKRHKRLSVDQITEEMGLAKTAVRRTLLTLERRGLIEREWVPAARGRPKLAFSLTPASSRLFSNKESEILEGLIQYLVNRNFSSLVEEFFAQYWDKKLKRVKAKLNAKKNKDLRSRLEILVSALEDEGFSPRLELDKKASKTLLRECHCPISAAASSTDIPCRMEKRFIEKVLNMEVDSVGRCEFQINSFPRRKMRGV